MTNTAWVNVIVQEGGPSGATIHYRLADDARVTLEIFDVLGNRVRSLVAGCIQVPGSYNLHWDGRDEEGRPVMAGDYLYRIKADAATESWKVDWSEEFELRA